MPNSAHELLFEVTVKLDNEEKKVEARLISRTKEPIVGVRLFSPYTVLINFSDKLFHAVKTDEMKKVAGQHKPQ